MGVARFEDAPRRELEIGHLHATWSLLGEAAGCIGVGVRRIEIHPGRWSTPAHEHGVSEELVYVLAGHGLSWLGGETYEIRAGDCILYRPRGGAHTLHALGPLDVLAFGPRAHDESPRFPRLGFSLVGGRGVETLDPTADGYPVQFVREAAAGPPVVPAEPSPRPATIVNVADAQPEPMIRPRIARTRRNLGRAVGSATTGLQHVEVRPGMLAAPLHCHSAEEEIFVVLEGDGTLLLDDEETSVAPGHVVARPAGTGVSHAFRAGESGLVYLAYGTREPTDVCYYPRSNKIFIRGIGVVARLEQLDYWDGED